MSGPKKVRRRIIQNDSMGAGGSLATQAEVLGFAISDETTPLTTGTSKLTFRLPFKMVITAVRASLAVAQTAGSTLTIDINQSGPTSIFSTRLTIDTDEKTSVTAAVPCAFAAGLTLQDDEDMTVDIDQVGTSPAGLKIWLIGRRAL